MPPPLRPICKRAHAPLFAPTAAFSTKPAIRSFPLPQLHIGIDLCSIDRIRAILAKAATAPSFPLSPPQKPPTPARSPQTPASRFIRRVLTPREIADLATHPTTPTRRVVAMLAAGRASTAFADTEDVARAARHLAGRFAAKEAAIKAHPHLRGLTLQSVRLARAHDADIARNGSGPPVAYVRLPATAQQGQIQEKQELEQEARISISHDGAYVTAVCIGFEPL